MSDFSDAAIAILTDYDRFREFIQNPVLDLGSQSRCGDLTDQKRWEIFSRIRFEYVRPFCTLRSTSKPRVRFPSLGGEELEIGLKAYLCAGLNPDARRVGSLCNALNNAERGTLGSALRKYYDLSGAIKPHSEPSLFPFSYIVVHDLHHVLLGSDTDDKGELEIICFESGMLSRSPAPILLLEQLEISLGDVSDLVESSKAILAWTSGSNASTLLESWNWLEVIDRPIKELRDFYNIVPLSTMWDD